MENQLPVQHSLDVFLLANCLSGKQYLNSYVLFAVDKHQLTFTTLLINLLS